MIGKGFAGMLWCDNYERNGDVSGHPDGYSAGL